MPYVGDSCVDHTFVESALTAEDQDLRVAAPARSPPIKEGGGQAKRVWQWFMPPLWCSGDCDPHLFACPAPSFFGCFVSKALGAGWEALNLAGFLETRAK